MSFLEQPNTVPALIHQETFYIRFFEAEPTGRASPSALCRFAHAAADGHCRTFGMSLAELRTQDKMWILTRFRLQMERYPQNGDCVTVETWASSRTNGIRAVRQFRFLDAHGETLGRASSIFLMMDRVRKRPVRLPPVVLALACEERTDLEEFELPRLTAPKKPNRQRMLTVGWKDLDANNHANNVSYMDWALEALPLAMNRDRTLVQFDIEFLAEALYADWVITEVEVGGSECRHQLKNGEGAVLGLAVSRWA